MFLLNYLKYLVFVTGNSTAVLTIETSCFSPTGESFKVSVKICCNVCYQLLACHVRLNF